MKSMTDGKSNIMVISKNQKELRSNMDLNMDDYLIVRSVVSQQSKAKTGIPNIIDNKWEHAVVGYEYIIERILRMEHKTNRSGVDIIAAYEQ